MFHRLQPLRRLPAAYLARVTILLPPAREWAFHVQWLVRLATIRSRPVLVQVLVLADLVRLEPAVQVLVRAVLVRLVPVARRAQVSVEEPPVALLVQVLEAVLLVPVAALQVLVAHVRPVAQVLAAAVTAAEPQARSVRAEAAVLPRPASRSARNAKSSSREWLLASVAQLCHVAMEPRCFVCVADRAFKTLPTRLKPLRLN